MHGFQHALQTGAAIALAGAFLSAILVRREHVAKPRPVAAEPAKIVAALTEMFR